jgi:hypothetical protein
VVVDYLGLERGKQVGQCLNALTVVGLVDHTNVDTGPLEASDAAAVGQRDDPDVIALGVETGCERKDMFLRATVGASGHDLDYSDPAAVDRLVARLVDARIGSAVVGAHS